MRLSVLNTSPASRPAPPSAGVQTDLVVLLRAIELLRCSRTLSLSLEYCSSLTEILLSSPPLSFSAHWQSLLDVQSWVGLRAEPSSEVLDFPELHFLREESGSRPAAETRHDPIGVVGVIQSFAEDGESCSSSSRSDPRSPSEVPASREKHSALDSPRPRNQVGPAQPHTPLAGAPPRLPTARRQRSTRNAGRHPSVRRDPSGS